ncbi:aldo/keto reductase [Auraticoccus sp. F435]|uniref:Aldo/keto reductase n=1 Tax=Auraticoccus cholistanensis TaxID=2656650 RepID=A0A6A9V165_9ACTN|nr:aldo/keto reductase [Auraticoccus cholistanensis]MVA76550.1 aldo/keto reductase [Auraticoccus cholistanensis]
MEPVALGRTGLTVSRLCLGAAPLGGWPAQYGHDVTVEQAVETVRALLDSPITFLDTSNNYYDAEARIGRALREIGGPPPHWVVATKVDPLRGSDDFSGDRVRRSVEESLQRLGLEHLPLVHLHDPERVDFARATGTGGAVEALVDLQAQGVIGHLGVAGGSLELERRYLRLGVFSVVLSHNRFTLLDQSAADLLAEAAELGVAFLNGAPYGGGMLVRGPAAEPRYCYRPASAEVLERARRIESLCADHGVPLAAAALQFSLREPRVVSTVVGMSSPQRVRQTLELAQHPVPDQLWQDLAPLTTGQRAVG